MWKRAKEIWQPLMGQVFASAAVIGGHGTYGFLSATLWLVHTICTDFWCLFFKLWGGGTR